MAEARAGNSVIGTVIVIVVNGTEKGALPVGSDAGADFGEFIVTKDVTVIVR